MPPSLHKPAALSHAIIAAAVFLVAALLYVNTTRYEFTWDDPMLLNAARPTDTARDLKRAFTTNIDKLYRPLRTIALTLENSLFEGRADASHAVNVFLYALTCSMFYLMAAALFGSYPPVALCAALLFAAHPLHAEVVSSIANGLADLLCAIFLFASLAIFIGSSRRAIPYILSLLLFALALISKESAVTLPVLIFMVAAMGISSESGEKPSRRLLSSAFSAAPFFILAGLFFVLRSRYVPGGSQVSSWHGGSFMNTMFTSFSVVPDYLLSLFVPVKQCPLYVVPVVDHVTLKFIAGVSIIAGSALAAVYLFRRAPLISFVLVFAILTWLPASNIVPIGSLKASRFMFLPTVTACIFAAMALRRVSTSLFPDTIRANHAAAAAAVAITLAYSISAVSASGAWRNPLTLWSTAVSCAENSPIAWNNYGRVCYNEGRIADAEKAFRKAIEINPGFSQPYGNLADIYGKRGRFDLAIKYLRESNRYLPYNATTCCKLCFAYHRDGRDNEALPWRQACINTYNSGIIEESSGFWYRTCVSALPGEIRIK